MKDLGGLSATPSYNRAWKYLKLVLFALLFAFLITRVANSIQRLIEER